MLSALKKTFIIANPMAHSGKGYEGAEFTRRFLTSYVRATDGFDLVYTTCIGDAINLAQKSAGYDTVLALGGDGVIHEVVTGLMQLPKHERPTLGIIPMGSGNDYARTLNLPINNPELAIKELMRSNKNYIDIGKISNGTEHTYFAQTLSFGLDAQVAHDTTKRRLEGTSSEGEGLFATSALKIISQAKQGWPCKLTLDQSDPIQLTNLILAIQIGKTYGGGFTICPDANPCDGVFDVCYNVRTPNIVQMLGVLALIRSGKHTWTKTFNFAKAKHIKVSFEGVPAPCQVDGELFEGTNFEIDLISNEIEIYLPQGFNATS